MSSIRLFPYPRIDSAVEWSRTSVLSSGQPVAPGELAERWDADSRIVFTVTAAVPNAALDEFSGQRPALRLSVGCKETAECSYAEGKFSRDSVRSYATASVELTGSRVAQQVEVRATITAPHDDAPWLARRILASRRVETINLDSELSGFPTSALSFKANDLKPAPWVLRVNAVALSDSCAQSVRLLLNEDYPRVVELIEGQARPYVEAALEASIVRTLLEAVRRLADEAGGDADVADAVSEFPDSIAAAAEKSCRDFLELSLPSALTLLRRRPEHVEHLIASSVNFLKEKQ